MDAMKRRTFGKSIFGALAGLLAVPFVKLKNEKPKPTEEERSRAIDSDTCTFSGVVSYVGKCEYSHTDGNGCRHFTINWEIV